jgi:hypothetical protein
VGTVAAGLSDEARSAASLPGRPTAKHLRRTKVIGAIAVAALVGIGTYAATYHALYLMSAPPAAQGSVTPITSGGPHTATVPSTATDSPAPPLH